VSNEYAAIFDPVRMLKHAIEQFWNEPDTAEILREAQRQAYSDSLEKFKTILW